MPANTRDNVFLNLGLGVNTQQATQDITDVVKEIQIALSQDFNIDIRANNLDELRQGLNALGGDLRIIKDDASGAVDAIQVSLRTANGELIRLNQQVELVNGKYQTMAGTDISERVVAGLSEIDKIQKQILSTRERLARAVADDDTATIKATSTQLQQLQSKLVLQRKINDILERSTDVQSAQAERATSVNLDAQTNSYVALVQRIGEAKSALKELEKAQGQVIKTADMSKTSAVYQDARNNVTELVPKVQEYVNLINAAAGAGVATFTVQNGEVVKLTSNYTGNNKALKEMNDYINNIGRSWASTRAKMSDQQSDTKKIEAAVTAYKSYRDAVEVVQKAKMNGRSATQQEKDAVTQAKQAYEQCEQAILSNGEAVRLNTTYNRDKNQVTRNSVNALKEYEAQLKSTNNSMSGSIAQMIQMKLSFEGLQEAITKIVDTAKDLDSAMTEIQLVTQQSNEEATQLMISYSGLAQQMGTTTAEVAASADEWLLIRSL